MIKLTVNNNGYQVNSFDEIESDSSFMCGQSWKKFSYKLQNREHLYFF